MDAGSEPSATSPEDSKPDDGEKRQNTRACDFCHRMKMKCIGKETPPCNRCRQSGQHCTFDGPRKSKAAKVEDRLKVVEEQMAEVQASLAELIALQRSNASTSASTAPMTPALGMSGATRVGSSRTDERRSLASLLHQHSSGSHSQSITPSQHNPQSASNYSPLVNIFDRSRSTIPLAPAPPLHPGPLGQSAGTPHGTSSVRGPQSHAPSHAHSRPDSRPASPLQADSGAQSEDEDDPLAPSEVIYNNMLRLAEAARLKADGQLDTEPEFESEQTRQTAPAERDRPLKRAGDTLFDYSIDGKRPRRADEAILKRALPIQRGNLTHQFQNPIELGFCTEEKGKQLFDLFMQGAAVYVPIFDPAVDTWENMCKTAPFTVTVLLMAGSKIEDAGGPPSELQKKCKDHAENIAMRTLFTPVARIDVLQAMIVLSSWGDTSWRPGGHALRIAMDMGLYRCLPYLAASGMGSDKTPEELEEERTLVVGARCWLAIYKSEFEMAFNLGRPALFAVESTLDHGRKFLQHPLSIPTDSRLVATCELLTLRLSIHQLYSIWPAAARIPNLDERIEEANISYAKWFKYWESYYKWLDIPRSNFLHESLYSQHAHALLHTNSRILHSVRSRRQVALLSEKRQGFLVQALRSAETLVSMALRGESYASHFAKANYYTHVGIAFAARMIIRLTSLIPEHVADIRQTGRDLEAITECLAQVPGFQFAQHIRDIVVKARRMHVLPPSSRSGSPRLGGAALPAEEQERERADKEKQRKEKEKARRREERDKAKQVAEELMRDHEHALGYPLGLASTPSSTTTSPKTTTSAVRRSASPDKSASATLLPSPNLPLDFAYAEQLLAGGQALDLQAFDTPDVAADPLFNLDMWFPFPPLESDVALGLSTSPFPSVPAGGVPAGGYWQ